jgi:hypothetical protein
LVLLIQHPVSFNKKTFVLLCALVPLWQKSII